jgi:hypothetical protein
MALLDIIIDTLRINCSVVQCTGYASDIEALFYLFFFPTVFIILLVYILTNFIFRGEGNTPRGLRLLISVTLYAFIIMEGLYTMFTSLSRFWWLFAVILIGLWAFIRHLIGGGVGKMPSLGGGALGSFAKGKLSNIITGEERELEKKINHYFTLLEQSLESTKKLAKDNPGSEAHAAAENRFISIDTTLEELIANYGKKGKLPVSENSGVNITRQAEKYWERKNKLSEEFKKISK